jgi:DNA-binding transcriptional LysR family regulator
MPPSRADLADFTYFLAIAKHKSFRRAGVELGVTASALSHALKGLENRLNVRLLNRTTHSVTLTAAGEELCAAIGEPFDAIGRAIEALNRFRATPAGRIRLHVSEDAAALLIGPVLPEFADRYPDVDVEISISNRMVDVIEQGYDAGIRFGGTVPEDMIAQRLSADIRWVVAGAPAYFERFGIPRHPHDLMQHRCVQIRLGSGHIYKWDFERGEEAFALALPGAITIDEANMARILALNGTGLIYASEPSIRPHIEGGALKAVLQDWAAIGEGYHIYYSSRRQLPTGLRVLIDLIKERRPLGS